MRAIQRTFHSLSIYNNIMSESIDDLLRDGTLVTKDLYCLDLPDTNLVPPTPVFGLPSPRCDHSLLISGIQCLFPINKAMEKKNVFILSVIMYQYFKMTERKGRRRKKKKVNRLGQIFCPQHYSRQLSVLKRDWV